MCFWPVPGRTDVLKCTLSPGTGDKCVAGPAPIICDRGDNHAPGGISTFWGSQGDPGGPSGAPFERLLKHWLGGHGRLVPNLDFLEKRLHP